jgi:hypothetical protein
VLSPLPLPEVFDEVSCCVLVLSMQHPFTTQTLLKKIIFVSLPYPFWQLLQHVQLQSSPSSEAARQRFNPTKIKIVTTLPASRWMPDM